MIDQLEKIKGILKEKDHELLSKQIGVEIVSKSFKSITSMNNDFEMNKDNLIMFYPINDGMPTIIFAYYKDNKLVLDNSNNYQEITNLDEILFQMVNAYDRALSNNLVLKPFSFMLKLEDEVDGKYKGTAKLILNEKGIMRKDVNSEENIYHINRFLDHFMGWNFGVSINRSEKLKNKLEELNNRVINMGLRRYAGRGFEVVGVDDEAYCGIQHYHLKTEKEKQKKRKNTTRK